MFISAPSGRTLRLEPLSPLASAFLLGFSQEVLDETIELYEPLGIDRRSASQWLSQPAVLPRTSWVHELVHRYAFERQALHQHHSVAARFLEVDIVKETLFHHRDRVGGTQRHDMQRRLTKPVRKALAYIEANTFEPAPVSVLAREASVSESSLRRAFRREVGQSPAAYWRDRRLDAALQLLRAGCHTVAEAAIYVGYANPDAFTIAFRRRFGQAPSSFRPTMHAKPAP